MPVLVPPLARRWCLGTLLLSMQLASSRVDSEEGVCVSRASFAPYEPPIGGAQRGEGPFTEGLGMAANSPISPQNWVLRPSRGVGSVDGRRPAFVSNNWSSDILVSGKEKR